MGRGAETAGELPVRNSAPQAPAGPTYYPNYAPGFDVEGLIDALREAAERYFAGSSADVEVSRDWSEDGYDGIEVTVDDCDVLQLKAVVRPATSPDGTHTDGEPQMTFYPRIKDRREKIILEYLAGAEVAAVSKIAETVAGRPRRERTFLESFEETVLAPLVGKGFLERVPVHGPQTRFRYKITALGRQALSSAPYLG